MDDGLGDLAARSVDVRLPSGATVKIETTAHGPGDPEDGMTSVALQDLHLDKALETVGEIAHLVWTQVGNARPSKATAELKFGFAVGTGGLTALWMGGKADATLTVTLEWSGQSSGPTAGDASTAAGGSGGVG